MWVAPWGSVDGLEDAAYVTDSAHVGAVDDLGAAFGGEADGGVAAATEVGPRPAGDEAKGEPPLAIGTDAGSLETDARLRSAG